MLTEVLNSKMKVFVRDIIDDIVHEKLAAIYRTQQQRARYFAAIIDFRTGFGISD